MLSVIEIQEQYEAWGNKMMIVQMRLNSTQEKLWYRREIHQMIIIVVLTTKWIKQNSS